MSELLPVSLSQHVLTSGSDIKREQVNGWINAFSLVLFPLPRQVPEASKSCVYLLLRDFPC